MCGATGVSLYSVYVPSALDMCGATGVSLYSVYVPSALDMCGATGVSLYSVYVPPALDMCGATGVPLDKCSTLNQQFWHSISAHIQTMAPTSVPLSDHTHILQRLQASPELQQLFAVLDLQHTVEWTCVAMVTSDNELIVFLLPWQLYSDCRDEGRGVALLPIVMFQCCQEQLLNSNLAESRPTEDVYLHFDLQTQPILTEVCPGLKDLLCQLRSLHTSCYLEQVHAALVQGLLLTQQDFLRGVTVCQTNTLSVDLTPLLAGLCAHSLTEFPSSPELGTKSAPLPSDVLSHLLSAALSKLTYTCVVRGGGREEGGAGEECQLRTQQINQTFRRHLDKLGLRAVTQCEQAYFWLDNENPKVSILILLSVDFTVVISLCSLHYQDCEI